MWALWEILKSGVLTPYLYTINACTTPKVGLINGGSVGVLYLNGM